MSRVLEYEPDEMVVVCEAGVTLDSVQQLLASHNQRLPLKLPHPKVSTLGGIVSTNRAGMLRASFGAPRDLLIGLTAVMSGGTVIKGGGKVVKNVAGYDLCKLFAGAFGTLGILAGVNFKTTVLTDEAITAIWRAPNLGSALTAGLNLHLSRLFTAGFSVTSDLNGDGPILVAYLQGIGERVSWQKQAIEDILVPSGFQPGEVATNAQDEYLLNSTSPAMRPGLLWTAHCSVLPTDLPSLAASITAECSDMRITVSPGTGEMFLTAVDGTDFWPWQLLDILPTDGNVRFTYVSSLVLELGQVSRWGKARPEAKLHRALKDRLDPENCFSPGRFIDGI
jgi:glycolate oxidase FAD binding subunit